MHPLSRLKHPQGNLYDASGIYFHTGRSILIYVHVFQQKTMQMCLLTHSVMHLLGVRDECWGRYIGRHGSTLWWTRQMWVGFIKLLTAVMTRWRDTKSGVSCTHASAVPSTVSLWQWGHWLRGFLWWAADRAAMRPMLMGHVFVSLCNLWACEFVCYVRFNTSHVC